MSTTSRSTRRSDRSRRRGNLSQRNVLVLAGLIGSLAVTSVLLLVLAPPPLTPDNVRSLMAPDGGGDSLDLIFKTMPPVSSGRWKYVYIHHSRTRAGDAATIGAQSGGVLPDHFLIGNGQGCADGEIQIGGRWMGQQAANPLGYQMIGQLNDLRETCISICLVGDFEQNAPTQTQMTRLGELVQTLQRQLGIPSGQVLWVDSPGSATGVGRRFPVQALGQYLLK